MMSPPLHGVGVEGAVLGVHEVVDDQQQARRRDLRHLLGDEHAGAGAAPPVDVPRVLAGAVLFDAVEFVLPAALRVSIPSSPCERMSDTTAST